MDLNQIIQSIKGTGFQLPKKSVFSRDWMSWYSGKIRGFHNYRIYNGNNYLELERKSLQMAKQVCETWANLLMNERCDIIIPDNKKKFLDVIFNETNFWVKANEGVEKSFALGKGAFVLNVVNLKIGEQSGMIDTSEAKIKIDFINELKMQPITIEDKNITECAFTSINSDSKNYVIHVKDERGFYKIHNYSIDSKGEIAQKYVFDTKSKTPWFFVIRPNISNNIITELIDEEIGISIFANSIDVLKAIDNKYDGFDWEYVLGRKRMFVSAEAWKINKVDGETVKTFDPYDTLFYQLPENDEGKPIITETQGDLRFTAYIEGIQQELDFLSMKCGLGESYYKFDGSVQQTATQVISENSTLYRNIKKHEILLEKALRDLTKAVIQASNDFTSIKFGDVKDEQITIKFDDSIIEDKETEMKRDRDDVTSGLMSKVEYRMKWYGEDEATAVKNVERYFLFDEITKYMPALTSGAMTPEQFVEKVYPKSPNKPAIIEYITEFLGPQPADDGNGLYDDTDGTGKKKSPDQEDEDEDEDDEE